MTSPKSASHNPRVLIIPAAGRGVRFKELGRQYPKCILPVDGVPIIVTTLSRLRSAGDFAHTVITAADELAATQIHDVLRMHQVTNVHVVALEHVSFPSPARSLIEAIHAAKVAVKGDFDVTVFLSDMVPAETVVWAVPEMETDTWGVVIKEDYERWCMVQLERSSYKITGFFDKPKTQPPTAAAACGVYRYSSADTLLRSFCRISFDESKNEMQFSDLASEYMKTKPLSWWVYTDSDFVDYGTLEEYQRARGLANKCRSFNDVKLDAVTRTVTKCSSNYAKVNAEADWIQNLPVPLKQYAPFVLEHIPRKGEYTMTQVRSTNLRDLALYIDRSYDTWKTVFERTRTYMNEVVYWTTPSTRNPNNDAFWDTIYKKTVDRVSGWDASELLEEMRWALEQIKNSKDTPLYYHGDLHFANMFYCFNYDDLTLVDPRGEIQGSIYYDIAKLAHSVYGRYDYIDADLYVKQDNGAFYYDRGHENIEKAFEHTILCNTNPRFKRVVFTLTASLFFSMIPLHQDNQEHCDLFFIEGEKMLARAKAIDIG